MMRPLSWDELMAQGSPWAYMVSCTEDEVDLFVARASGRHSAGTIRIIRGERCSTAPQLLQEWAAALQFPYYFGHNWDAFEECLADLSWLAAPAYVFFVTRVDHLLDREPPDFTLFVDILKNVASEWAGRNVRAKAALHAVTFRVIFHSEPASADFAHRRLSDASLKAVLRELPEEISQ